MLILETNARKFIEEDANLVKGCEFAEKPIKMTIHNV